MLQDKTDAQVLATMHARFRSWQALAVLLVCGGVALIGYVFGTSGDQWAPALIGGFVLTAGVKSTINAAVLKMQHVAAVEIHDRLSR
jgi:hypothetical protein